MSGRPTSRCYWQSIWSSRSASLDSENIHTLCACVDGGMCWLAMNHRHSLNADCWMHKCQKGQKAIQLPAPHCRRIIYMCTRARIYTQTHSKRFLLFFKNSAGELRAAPRCSGARARPAVCSHNPLNANGKRKRNNHKSRKKPNLGTGTLSDCALDPCWGVLKKSWKWRQAKTISFLFRATPAADKSAIRKLKEELASELRAKAALDFLFLFSQSVIAPSDENYAAIGKPAPPPKMPGRLYLYVSLWAGVDQCQLAGLSILLLLSYFG